MASAAPAAKFVDAGQKRLPINLQPLNAQTTSPLFQRRRVAHEQEHDVSISLKEIAGPLASGWALWLACHIVQCLILSLSYRYAFISSTYSSFFFFKFVGCEHFPHPLRLLISLKVGTCHIIVPCHYNYLFKNRVTIVILLLNVIDYISTLTIGLYQCMSEFLHFVFVDLVDFVVT